MSATITARKVGDAVKLPRGMRIGQSNLAGDVVAKIERIDESRGHIVYCVSYRDADNNVKWTFINASDCIPLGASQERPS